MNIMRLVTLAISLFLVSGLNAAPLRSLMLTGGSFNWAGVEGTIEPAAYSYMSVDGSYDGSAPTSGSYDLYTISIATGQFGLFGPMSVYTSEFDDGSSSSFAPVSGDLTGNDLVLDLSSWTVWWNGTSTNQGAANVATVVDAYGEFTASWEMITIGGATDGLPVSWTITGYVTAVPLPSALWLTGSGLLCLAGFLRRQKNRV